MKKTLLLTTVGLLAFAGSVSADTVIYYDQFTYYPNQLNGQQPDTVDTGGYGGTPGAVWIAASQWVAIDTSPDVPPTEAGAVSQYANGYLPFTPLPGLIYTLSASLAGGRDDVVDLGFTQNAPLNGNFINPATIGDPEANAGPFIQLVDDSGEVDVYHGPGYTNTPSNGPVVTGSEPNNPPGLYSIVLDTSTSAWTFSVTGPDGFSTGPLDFPNGNPTINFVGIGNFDDDGTDAGFVDDFKLSVGVVPEPSTYMLLSLGGLALFIVSRRRASRMI